MSEITAIKEALDEYHELLEKMVEDFGMRLSRTAPSVALISDAKAEVRRIATELARLREDAEWYRLLAWAICNDILYESFATDAWRVEHSDIRITRGPDGLPVRTPEALAILREARAISRPMSPEEEEEQRRSFAHGNCSIDNPNVTREVIDCEADKMKEQSDERQN